MKHKRLFEAAIARFKADRDEARALLEVYLNDSVGVGDHASLVNDVTELTRKLTEAEENIRTLRTIEHHEGTGNRDRYSDRGKNHRN